MPQIRFLIAENPKKEDSLLEEALAIAKKWVKETKRRLLHFVFNVKAFIIEFQFLIFVLTGKILHGTWQKNIYDKRRKKKPTRVRDTVLVCISLCLFYPIKPADIHHDDSKIC